MMDMETVLLLDRIFDSPVTFISWFAIPIGLLLFIAGFRWAAERRFLEHLPVSRIRSLAMGIVKIKGKVHANKGEKVLLSPLTRTKCMYYWYMVDDESDKLGSALRHGTKSMPFRFRDSTGEVLVNPEDATIMLNSMVFFQPSETAKSPKWVEQWFRENEKKMRRRSRYAITFREAVIKPGDELFIIGSAVDNPFVAEATGQKNVDDIMIHKGFAKSYGIYDETEEKLLSSLKWKARIGLFGGGGAIIITLIAMIFSYGIK